MRREQGIQIQHLMDEAAVRLTCSLHGAEHLVPLDRKPLFDRQAVHFYLQHERCEMQVEEAASLTAY